MTENLEINKREYPSKFSKTAIVICLDGSQKEYLEEASKLNLTPNIDAEKSMLAEIFSKSISPVLDNWNRIDAFSSRFKIPLLLSSLILPLKNSLTKPEFKELLSIFKFEFLSFIDQAFLLDKLNPLAK